MVTAKKARLDWRGDIEGLRAVAIVPVLLFHFDPSCLPGGFLGVDIFFVISGFLITKILSGNPSDTVQSYLSFLIRRFRRIFPSLLVVFAVFSIVFSFFFVPHIHQPFFLTALSSFLGVSNIYLAQTQVDYFAQDANLNPFLHSWSIGVEMQFYTLYGAVFFTLKHFLKQPRVFNITGCVLALIAMALSLTVNQTTTGSAYFSVFARGWEFMLGVLAFMLLPASERLPTTLKNSCFFLALIGLLAVFYVAEKSISGLLPFLLACTAVALLLLLGDHCALAQSILGNRAIRTVGRLSFSLYIVHFPVLKCVEYYFDTQSTDTMALALYLVGTVFLASFNTVYVERRFIRSKESAGTAYLSTKRVLLPLFMLSVLTVVVSLYLINPRVSMAKGFETSFARPKLKPLLEGTAGEVVVIGDSHAQQLYPAFEIINREHHVQFVNKTGSACFFSEDLFYSRQGKIETRCKKHLQKTLAWLKKTSNPQRLVLVATRSLYYLAPVLLSESDVPIDGVLKDNVLIPAKDDKALQAFLISLATTLKELEDAQVKVLYMAPLPELQVASYRCLFNPIKVECHTSQAVNRALREKLMQGLRQLEEQFAMFRVWEPFNNICPHAWCENIVDGKMVYRDDDHLTLEAAAMLAPDLWQRMETFQEIGAR